MFVLDTVDIKCVGYQWPIQEELMASLRRISEDSKADDRLMRVKQHFGRLKASTMANQMIAAKVAGGGESDKRVIIEEVIMGDKHVTHEAGKIVVGGDVKGGVLNIGDRATISTDVKIDEHGNVSGSRDVSLATGEAERATADSFIAAIVQMRELLRVANFSTTAKDAIETELTAAEHEAKEGKPKLATVESALKRVEAVAKSTEGIGTAASKLIPMLAKAIDMARLLFP